MRKYGDNMKCAFISVLMNLIYGEGPEHNFLPSKSAFKSAICLCYPADITTPLFILKYWTYSEWCVFFSLFSQLLSCCETLYGNSAQMIHINNQWIRKIVLLSGNVVTSTFFVDSLRFRVIIGTPDSDDSYWAPPVNPWRSLLSSCCSDPRGAGAPASCILSELEFG